MLDATAAGLAALVIFVVLFLIAERARTVGESLRIASEAELRLDDQLDLAARLALISSSIDVNVNTESALLLSLTSGQPPVWPPRSLPTVRDVCMRGHQRATSWSFGAVNGSRQPASTRRWKASPHRAGPGWPSPLGTPLHVLDVPTGDIERTVEGSFMSVSAAGDDLLVAGMDDGVAVLIEDDKEPHQIAFEEHRGTLDAVTSDLSRRWIITGGDDRVIRVWDIETLDLVTSLVGHNERVLDVTLNQTASKLVSVDEAGLMLVWDMVEFSQIGSPFRQPAFGLAHSAEFSASSPELLYVAGPGLLTWRIGHEQFVESACELAGNRQLTTAESQQYLDGRDSGDVCSDTDGS